MTGASGSAEPCEVCVLNKDEFYHLEGWELPRGPEAGGGRRGSPENCSAPGAGDAPAASLSSVVL